MTLRSNELAEVMGEIARELVGQKVQKVVEPDARTLWLGFPRAWLHVSLDARAGRIHLGEKPAGTGEAAPAFCMLLRKELIGARLTVAESVARERAARLEFRHGEARRELRVLLFGVGARAILVGEEGRVMGAIGARNGATELPPPRALPHALSDEPSRFSGDSPSLRIAAHYSGATRETTVDDARVRALAEARRAIAKLDRRVAALTGDAARATAAEHRREHADLLLAYLDRVPRGASQVELPNDFLDGAPLTIPLDPAYSPRDNALRLYREHQRMQRGRKTIESRLAQTINERQAATDSLRRLEDPTSPLPPPMPLAAVHSSSRTPTTRPPFHRFRSSTGAEIWVGRGASKNDELTFHFARGDDLWMHTRDVPGAHVVVPRPGGIELDGETLLDAATLAVHHSPARSDPQADVTYVARKLVRKPRGAAPGRVTVAGGKTLRLRMEPARLARLLATRS